MSNGQQHARQPAHQQPENSGLPSAIEEILIETGSKQGLSPRNQYELLRTQIAPGCTDDELAHFLYVCKSRGLDPFAKQAYAIRRQMYDREARAKVWKMTIQTGIDGFRVIAKRAGIEAQDEPEFEYSERACDPDLNPLGLVKCTVRVWKKGSERPTTTSAYWDEYRQVGDEYENGVKTGNKKLSGKWFDMPRTMLAKVAEALTLRRAFPEDLGGLYTTEEMDRSTSETSATARPAAAPTMPTGGLIVSSFRDEIAAAQDVKALAAIGKRLVDAKIGEDDRKVLRGIYAHRKSSLAKSAKEDAAGARNTEEAAEAQAREAARGSSNAVQDAEVVDERQPGEEG